MQRTSVLSALSALSLLLLSCEGKEEAWKAALGHPYGEARVAALEALTKEVKAGDIDYLAWAARDEEPGVRAVAARGLGRSQEGPAVDLLSNLLTDPNESVQTAAAAALAQHGTEKARQYLLLRFPQSRRATRQAIVEALRASGVVEPMKEAMRFEAQGLWEEARQTLLAPPSLAEQARAALRIAESGREEAAGLLLPLLQQKPPAVIAAAAEGLGKLGAQAALPELEGLMLSHDAQVRKASIEAVAALQAPRSIPLLLQLTKAEEAVALLALEALERFPPLPEIDEALCALALHPGSPPLRLRAAQGLKGRAPCAPTPLFEQLEGPLANTALNVLKHWPEPWEDEGGKVRGLLKSADLPLSTLAADLLADTCAQGKPKAEGYLWERIEVLSKKEARWLSAPLESSFGARMEAGGAERERRRRQEQLIKGVEERKAEQLKGMGQEAVKAVLLPELAENLSAEEAEQLAAFLKLASLVEPERAEGHLKRYAGASEASVRAAALGGLARLGPAHWSQAEEGLFEGEERIAQAIAKALIGRGVEGEKRLLKALEKRSADSTELLELLTCQALDEESAGALMLFLEKGIREAGAALRCLGKAKYTGALEKLLGLLKSEAAVDKRAILEALKEMLKAMPKEVEAQGGLKEMLKEMLKEILKEIENQLFHESPEIRAAAAGALGPIGVGELKEMKEADYFRRVRDNVFDNI